MTAPAASTPSPRPSSLSLADARLRILSALTPLDEHEDLPLHAALGRVLATDVIAPFAVPARDNSAMDGYALRAADLAADGDTALTVIGTAFAGNPFAGTVGPGEAVRIMTGAEIPPGADTVVMQESVRRDGERVLVPAGQHAGQNVRRAGEDLAPGSVALPAGRRIRAAELGLLGSLGQTQVRVTRRLRVAFFSTGDELADLGHVRQPGQIYDSNRHTLFGALARLGCEGLDLGVIRDEPAALEAAFRRAAAEADVIVTSGGVSVGDADFVRELMGRLGSVDFWKLDIKPGRPMAFGRLGKAWMFGLPGNPVAVMVTFYELVQDALLRLAGVDPLPPRPLLPAVCTEALRKQPGRREFMRGQLRFEEGVWTVRTTGPQGSGILRSMSDADCLIVLGEAQGNVSAGERVFVQPFDGLL